MNHPRALSILTTAALAALTTGAMAQNDAATAKFLEEAVRGNLAEIRMGELAQQRGKDGDVRDFGETLVEDHTKGAQKTADLAKLFGVTPPTEPDAEAKKMYDTLAKLDGEAFDREFAAHMVMAHQKTIAKLESPAANADPQVAAVVKELLPTVQAHLETAQELANEHTGAQDGSHRTQ